MGEERNIKAVEGKYCLAQERGEKEKERLKRTSENYYLSKS